jgi:hypothetical protein
MNGLTSWARDRNVGLVRTLTRPAFDGDHPVRNHGG